MTSDLANPRRRLTGDVRCPAWPRTAIPNRRKRMFEIAATPVARAAREFNREGNEALLLHFLSLPDYRQTQPVSTHFASDGKGSSS